MREDSILPRRFAFGVYVTASVATVALLVVHTTGLWDWQVDAATFGLIGVLLLVPAAERLRKFKFGKYFEAEFEERVKGEIDHLGRRVGDLTEAASSPTETALAGERILERAFGTPATTIRRIVWVDDRPEGNRLERAELERRFEVVTATSTAEGLEKVPPAEVTAVITDAVRVEGGRENRRAGVDLIEALGKRHPAVPVYVYCRQETVDHHSEPLIEAGARLVTASFVELARKIRAEARVSFEAEIAGILGEHGAVEPQSGGVDFIVAMDGLRVGVEAKDYRRTPKREPLDASAAKLGDAIVAGDADLGLLVAPRDVFISAQRERSPEGVRLIPVAELANELSALRGSAAAPAAP